MRGCGFIGSSSSVSGPGFTRWSLANPWPGINHFDVLTDTHVLSVGVVVSWMLTSHVRLKNKLRQGVSIISTVECSDDLWAFRGPGVDNF